MTILINFLGCPSSGKSSLASKVFAKLKAMELNAEYVTEFVKGWAWEGKEVGIFGQYYIFGKETHNQSRLFGKVDFAVADSPVMLTAFYHYYYNDGNNSLREACKDFYRVAEEKADVKVINFFLPRKKRYQKKGRYQTQEQADKLALDLKDWLDREGYEYEVLNCPDKERADVVIERLKELTNNFEGMIEEEEPCFTELEIK